MHLSPAIGGMCPAKCLAAHPFHTHSCTQQMLVGAQGLVRDMHCKLHCASQARKNSVEASELQVSRWVLQRCDELRGLLLILSFATECMCGSHVRLKT